MSFGKWLKHAFKPPAWARKIQPGVLIKDATKLAASAGVPGAGAALGVENAVGKVVDSAGRVAAHTQQAVSDFAKAHGISTAAAAAQLANRGLNAADQSMQASDFVSKNKTILLVGAGVVLLFVFMRGK